MNNTTTTKYLRLSPRKVRLVVDSVRSLSPTVALSRLKNQGKSASGPVHKAILSAIDSAKQRGLTERNLKFKYIEVNEGPAMKRWRAVSRGMAHTYKKRMSHIKVVLTDEEVHGAKN